LPELYELRNVGDLEIDTYENTIKEFEIYKDAEQDFQNYGDEKSSVVITDLKSADVFGRRLISFFLASSPNHHRYGESLHYGYYSDDHSNIFSMEGYWLHNYLIYLNDNDIFDVIKNDIINKKFLVIVDGEMVKSYDYIDNNPIYD
jgi:hypothetical protein